MTARLEEPLDEAAFERPMDNDDDPRLLSATSQPEDFVLQESSAVMAAVEADQHVDESTRATVSVTCETPHLDVGLATDGVFDVPTIIDAEGVGANPNPEPLTACAISVAPVMAVSAPDDPVELESAVHGIVMGIPTPCPKQKCRARCPSVFELALHHRTYHPETSRSRYPPRRLFTLKRRRYLYLFLAEVALLHKAKTAEELAMTPHPGTFIHGYASLLGSVDLTNLDCHLVNNTYRCPTPDCGKRYSAVTSFMYHAAFAICESPVWSWGLCQRVGRLPGVFVVLVVT